MPQIDVTVPRDLRDLETLAAVEKVRELRRKVQVEIDKRKEVTPSNVMGFSLEEMAENFGLFAKLNFLDDLENRLLTEVGRG